MEHEEETEACRVTLLEVYIATKNLNETQVMNALQDNGVISDQCVWASDVSETDCAAAIRFLNNQNHEKQSNL